MQRRSMCATIRKENTLVSLKSYFLRLFCFLKNIYFVILMLASGILGGTLFSIFAFVNQIVKSAFCDQSVSFYLKDFCGAKNSFQNWKISDKTKFWHNSRRTLIPSLMKEFLRIKIILIKKFRKWQPLWLFAGSLVHLYLVLSWTERKSSNWLWFFVLLFTLCLIFCSRFSIEMVGFNKLTWISNVLFPYSFKYLSYLR